MNEDIPKDYQMSAPEIYRALLAHAAKEVGLGLLASIRPLSTIREMVAIASDQTNSRLVESDQYCCRAIGLIANAITHYVVSQTSSELFEGLMAANALGTLGDLCDAAVDGVNAYRQRKIAQ